MARILVGVSGGIAAYKAVELVRLATGAATPCAWSRRRRASQFVGRATFEGVTGAPVLVDEFERDPARGAYPGEPAPDARPDLAPRAGPARRRASASRPRRPTRSPSSPHGLADNLLTSAALACTAPLVVAPAMNNHMYEHPATQRQPRPAARRAARRSSSPTAAGWPRAGEWGVGRLAEPAAHPRDRRGPARQGGRADGRAARARDRRRHARADRLGPLRGQPLVRPHGDGAGRRGRPARRRGDGGGRQRRAARARRRDAWSRCRPRPSCWRRRAREFGEAHVLLMAAAVADFRPGEAVDDKISKSGRDGLALALEPTEDVLAALAAARAPGPDAGRLRRRARRGRGRARARQARAQGARRGRRQRHLAPRDRLRRGRQRGHDRHRGRRAARAAGRRRRRWPRRSSTRSRGCGRAPADAEYR